MIAVRGVRYRYPGAARDALDGVDLSIDEGAFVVIAGDSGSGKSTLAGAMTGLVPHFHGGVFAGSVMVGGRDTRTVPPRDLADVIGSVAQDPATHAVVDRVEDEIAFTMENLGVEPIMMRKRMEEVLDAVGVAALRARRLGGLSGGERQRVAIAAALAAHPRALVLDEPTSQLDPQSAEDVLGVLQRLNADLGVTIVLVEHRLERVVQFADRIVVMGGGRVSADGTPREVLGSGAVATPVSRLGRALGWEPIPLTVRDGRAFARRLESPPRPAGSAPTPAEQGAVLVAASGLRVALGDREVLAGVDLVARAGEVVAIVGRNGAGKTTLLRTLAGLVRPMGGTRIVAGRDPSHTPVEVLAGDVAYVPQSADAILFHESVRDELAFTLRARGGSTDEALREAELDDLAPRDPRSLSAGERLRAAIAAATAGEPAVILLDEPTRGMDAAGKERLAGTMRAWRARGAAVLLVTHDVELVARAATHVVLMAEGRAVVDGPVREVLGESALFSSQMNKVFGDRRILTVEDALAAVGHP